MMNPDRPALLSFIISAGHLAECSGFNGGKGSFGVNSALGAAILV
jgi:hypothetical protein